MTEMSVTEFSRNLAAVFDRIEHKNEEIVLIRNRHVIARIIPGSPRLSALEAMGDLYGTIDEKAAKNWENDSRINETLDPAKNRWDT